MMPAPFTEIDAMLHRRTLALPLLLALAACGGDPADTSSSTSESSGTPSGGTGGDGGGSSVPTGQSLKLEIEAFDVQPGTERQVCKIINLPADKPFDVVRFQSKMVGVSHHFNVYKALTNPTEPATESERAVHDCEPGSDQLNGDAAYIFGSATPERAVDMPPAVAFHLEPGQRIILEQHVINTSPSVIQGGVSFEIWGPESKAQIEHHADVMWFANWAFFIQPNQETSFTKHCTVPYGVEVFGLMSHTHGLGTHFSIETWKDGVTDHLYDSTDWKHPIYQQHNPPFSLAAGEGLEWTCTWTNPTPNIVGPGKNSTDEMCMTFAYAYPTEGMAGDPIQCN
jgi:hypothetical protein